MKKILTLFAMLLVTVSTILAQQSDQHPKLTYQLVVRNNTNATVGEFAPNDLVYNANVEGKLSITGTTYAAVFRGKTNMNGMLSLTIVDESYQGSETNVVKLPVNSLRKIDWKGSKIVVEIVSYGIHDEMEVLPVPYALNALNHDTLLTTLAITNYLKDINEEDVNQVIAAFFANEYPIAQYSQDTLVNYIKAHRTAIKNLILHFLGKVNTDDVADAYQAYKANTKLDSAVVDTVKKYIINNYDVAKEIGLAYIGQIDTNDVRRVLNAVNENPQFDDIVSILADSTLKYLSNHKQLVWKALKKFLDAVTVDEIDYAYNYFKDNRSADSSDLYPHMRSELDALVQAYLDENGYLKKCSTDPDFDICNIAASIENLENNPNFIKCPDLLTPDTNRTTAPTGRGPLTVTSEITHIPDAETYTLNVPSDSAFFELSYPSTQFKKDTIYATIDTSTNTNTNGNSYSMKAEISDSLLNKADIIRVQAFLMTKCTPLSAQKSATFTIDYTQSSEPRCPNTVTLIVNEGNEDYNSATKLAQNKGILLSGTVDVNYGNLNKAGFIVDYWDIDGQHKSDILPSDIDNFTFKDTLGMNYCSRTVTLYSFVLCKGDTIKSDGKTITVRGPKLEILADPGTVYHAFADSLKLTARSQFEVGSNASQYCSGLSAGTYRVEHLMTACSTLMADNGISGDIQYSWTDAPTVSDSILKVAPDSTHVYEATLSMSYLGQTCKVKDTIKITYKPYECSDSIFVNRDTLVGPKVSIAPDTNHPDTLCIGSTDTITLAAASYIIQNGNTTYLKDVVKVLEYQNGLIDSIGYRWTDTLGNPIQREGDTLRMTVDRDSLIVCELYVKFNNDTVCVKYDTILVKYKFVCGTDSMRDAMGNRYPTVKIGSRCWMAQNMRSSKNGAGQPIDQGQNSGSLADVTSAEYYDISSVVAGNQEIQITTVHLGLMGYHYNWYAAMEVCPSGWYLPSDAEWCEMEYYVDTLGTNQTPADTMCDKKGWRGSHAAKLMKAGSWTGASSPISTGFNAVPAGYRGLNKYPGTYNDLTYFWTSTENGNVNNTPTSYYRQIHEDMEGVQRHADLVSTNSTSDNSPRGAKYRGYSVRCVKVIPEP